MARLVAGKLLHLALVLVIVSFALTFLIDLTPGDPAFAILGPEATDEQVATVHETLGLDDSLVTRYGRWLGDLATFDFGTSYITRQPVLETVGERLPVTAELIGLTLVIALAISVPVGVYTAYRADGRFDRAWMVANSAIVSVPPFVTALVLVFLLALQARVFPATGWVALGDDPAENLRHIFLPALTLALVEIPSFSRLLRADMITTLQEDYILAARARGVPTTRILVRHALRPSSFSLVTLAGLSLGRLIGGAVVVEVLFALPGLGQFIVNSIQNKDIPAVQGVVMFVAVLYVVVNLLLDVSYGYLDPRARARRVAA